jgi:hypothetical protein
VPDYPQVTQTLVDKIAEFEVRSPAQWPEEFKQYVNGFIEGTARQYEMTVMDVRKDILARAEAQRWENMLWPTWFNTFHSIYREDAAELRDKANGAGYRYFLFNDCVWESATGNRVDNFVNDKARWTKADVQ